MGWIRARRPSPAMLVGLLALVVALGGTSWASSSKGGGKRRPPKHGDASQDRSLVRSMAGGLSVKFAKSAGSAGSASRAAHALLADHATVADSAGSAAPSGVAGGDLQGSYPNPTLKAPVVTGLTIPAVVDCQAHALTLCAQDANGYWNQNLTGLAYGGVIVDALGFVHLQGAIEVIQDVPTTAFYLPASMRPSADLVFAAWDNKKNIALSVVVHANGAVEPSGGYGDGSVISLSGISFHP